MPGVLEGPKRALGQNKLQLQTVVSYLVGSGNQIYVVRKDCMYLYPLRHPFCPHTHPSLHKIHNGYKVFSASFIVWPYKSHTIIYSST